MWEAVFGRRGFGGKFRDWCNQAGLPHCSAHGLRKATAARLAERGASPHEIMANGLALPRGIEPLFQP